MLNKEDEPKSREQAAASDGVKRTCMMCKEAFVSEWSGERICKRCRGSGAWKHSAAYRAV
jgi:DnaJ-class molecular chaperone